MFNRIEKLKGNLAKNNIDGALLYSRENRRYMSGFTGSAGFVIIGGDRADFITDFRYQQQAEMQCKGYNIVIHSNNAVGKIKEAVEAAGIKKLGIEDGFMTVSFHEELKKALTGVELVPLKNMLELQRAIKDNEEIKLIEKAADISDKAFEHVIKLIKPGMAEIEVALELEFFMKRNGASNISFDTIVASGERSSLPHGVASEKKINSGEFLTLDFGCVYNGYCSDITRTVFIGKATPQHRRIYDIVYKAEAEALGCIKPGSIGKAVDKVARDIIAAEGYGEYFGHGLGHGVGLIGHEEPRLNMISESLLEAGMVVTDEPGIYIPGFGGVRIEDLVLVTENGNRVLSKATKELLEL